MLHRASVCLVITALAVLVCVSGCSGTSPTQPQQPQPPVETIEVPSEYRSLYDELDAKLNELAADLTARVGEVAPSTVFSAELLEANSNRGEELLTAANLAACTTVIERFMEMGVGAVTLSINYPILNPSFPRASEFLDFFRKVAAEIKRKGLKLIVETTSIFPEAVYSDLGVSYAGLTLDRYKQEKRLMARTVASELRPDYLTVEEEPTTQTRNTGLDFSVTNQTEIVNYILEGLDRSNMKVGAGAGTWDDLAFFRSLAQNTPVDYLDMHLYPVQDGFVIDRTEEISAIARDAGKELTVGESWLYKASQGELGSGIATDQQAFARDAFSFWAPLDRKYLLVMELLCADLGIEFYSPFWSKYFFGYLDYEGSMRDADFAHVSRLANREIWSNVQAGTLSSTGETYRDIAQR